MTAWDDEFIVRLSPDRTELWMQLGYIAARLNLKSREEAASFLLEVAVENFDDGLGPDLGMEIDDALLAEQVRQVEGSERG